MQPDAFADAVITLVKNALAPVQERLAAAEARLVMLGDVRDRVVVLETKEAQPIPVALAQPIPEPVDLSPVLERVAATEAVLKTIGDLRDRVVVMETKSAQPIAAPVTEPAPPVDLSPVFEKVDVLSKDLNALRERVAVDETRAFIPGPMGRDGQPGRDGKDGTNGVDGVGWDDLAVKHDGERTFAVQFFKGDRVKDAGSFTVPLVIYRGVYVQGKTYEPGDAVSYGGSVYHCKKTTVIRPDAHSEIVNGEYRGPQGRDFWTMMVRAGREGRQGGTPQTPLNLPVVSTRGTSK